MQKRLSRDWSSQANRRALALVLTLTTLMLTGQHEAKANIDPKPAAANRNNDVSHGCPLGARGPAAAGMGFCFALFPVFVAGGFGGTGRQAGIMHFDLCLEI